MRRVTRGDKLAIRADTWNAMAEVAAHHNQQRFGTGGPFGGTQSTPTTHKLTIRNDTGGPLPRLAVVGLDGPLIDPDDNLEEFLAKPALSGILPDPAIHHLRCAITQQPLDSGAIGTAVVSGITPVQVDVIDTDHEYAALVENVTGNLESADSGSIKLLWKTEGSGVQWGLALMPVGGSGGAVVGGWEPETITVQGGNELTDGVQNLGPGLRKRDGLIPNEDWYVDGVVRNPGATALAGAVTLSGQVLTQVDVTSGGSAYKAVDDMSDAEKACVVSGGGGSGAIVQIATVTQGAVTSLTINNGGSGYTSAPTITLPRPTGEPLGLPWPDGCGFGDLFNQSGFVKRVLVAHDLSGPVSFALPRGSLVSVAGQQPGSPKAAIPLFIH